jgi:5,10-methylenetetrahydromethanopterin reductase
MKFGIRFNSDSGAIKDVVRWAQLAEDLGFDHFWYCQDLMKRDAWVALTAVAAATSRIRLGTCIVNPFTVSPAEIAMHAATLQEFCEGRFVLGIGPGDPPYRDWVGLPQAQPRRGLAEAVTILRRLLAGEEVSFDGSVFKWREAKLRMPAPAQPIPIYIGGQGPRVLELMGELGDGALPIVFPPETIDFVNERIQAGLARRITPNQSTNNPFDLAACVWWSVAQTQAQAEDALRYLIAYYGPSLRDETLNPIGLTMRDFDAVRAAWQAGEMNRAMHLITPAMFRLAIYGAPQDMVAKVHWLQSKGVTQINIGPPLGPDREQALRFTAERVMGEFR